MKDSIFDGHLNIEVAVASGIEAVTKRELAKLGYTPSGANYGRIEIEGDIKDVYRTNIFLRTANRVRVILTKFRATTFDELFDGVFSYDWQYVLSKDARIIVDAKSLKSALFALRVVQSITKKAIISKLSTIYKNATFNESGAPYNIEVNIVENEVCISLDTSGDGLHKRGYRTYLGEAPIRETLAAAMIELSVWNWNRALIDPFCGSGTIPIEACMIALNIAPCMNRSFAIDNFVQGSAKQSVIDEANALINRDKDVRISGFDINPDAIALAMKHAQRAGVRDKIHFQVGDMRDVSSRFSHGCIITNPPYGERLMSEDELKALYRDFGKMTSNLNDWCVYAITSYKAFEKYYGKRADKVRKLYNSELECGYYTFLAPLSNKQTHNLIK